MDKVRGSEPQAGELIGSWLLSNYETKDPLPISPSVSFWTGVEKRIGPMERAASENPGLI